jgi:hypothetical protein
MKNHIFSRNTFKLNFHLRSEHVDNGYHNRVRASSGDEDADGSRVTYLSM